MAITLKGDRKARPFILIGMDEGQAATAADPTIILEARPQDKG